jgi:hypothetical protein
MEDFALYYTYASLGLTAAHQIVQKLQEWALTTPSEADDEVVSKIAGVLAALDGLLGFFAMRLGKK